MVKDPEEYLWSSHNAYLGKESLPCLYIDTLLDHFGTAVTESRGGYRRFMLDGLGEGHRPEFHGTGDDSRLLGNDSFVEKCLSGSDDIRLRLTAQEIADKVSDTFAITETDLKSPSQCRKVSEARAVVGWLAHELGCVTLSEVGKLVNRDVGSISSAVRRLSIRMREEPELTERVLMTKVALELT